MTQIPDIGALDLAALLCSKLCHDIISPAGAIANGLELLDEGGDEESRAMAMDLIRSSASSASARLQFARIAYGAAGSTRSEIDLGEAEEAALRYFAHDSRTTLEWHGERGPMAKNHVKLLLNLLLIAQAAIPRGGKIIARVENSPVSPAFAVSAMGRAARVPEALGVLLNGEVSGMPPDAHTIQPLYAVLLAKEAGMGLSAIPGEDVVHFRAQPALA